MWSSMTHLVGTGSWIPSAGVSSCSLVNVFYLFLNFLWNMWVFWSIEPKVEPFCLCLGAFWRGEIHDVIQRYNRREMWFTVGNIYVLENYHSAPSSLCFVCNSKVICCLSSPALHFQIILKLIFFLVTVPAINIHQNKTFFLSILFLFIIHIVAIYFLIWLFEKNAS